MTAQGNSPVDGEPNDKAEQEPPVTPEASRWGRVGDDGTVYVRTNDGEKAVGQYPAGSPEEAMSFFTRRFEAIEFEVHLLEQRVRAEAMSPDEATESIKQVAAQLAEPNAVGDYVALAARLDALMPLIGVQRGKRREDKARKVEASRTRKAEIVAEAEKVSQGKDWRNGVKRLRDLLEEWKALPRLDKSTDDELWHRFSSARTLYTRRRKAHFAELDEQRQGAQVIKERLVKEAEALSGVHRVGSHLDRYRTLMQEWKAAGAAPRDVEDKLWSRFRTAQDTFFNAREAVNAEQDREFAANAVKKEEILVEAEALLPIKDLDAAKRAFRDLSDRWEAAGKVPRDQIKSLEARIRKVEQAIRSLEDDQWNRSDPEKSARADDMLGQLQRAIAAIETDLAAARDAGDTKRVKRLEDDLASKQAFLDMAKLAASDFS